MYKKSALILTILGVLLSLTNFTKAYADEGNWVFGNQPVQYQAPDKDWFPQSTPQNTPAQTLQTPQYSQQNISLPQTQQYRQPDYQQTFTQMPISNTYNSYQPQGFKIPAGTAVTIHNTQEINADYLNKGQTVEFSVDSPVIINGVTVIKAGTRATAEVLNKKNNFIFGIPGEIQVGNFKLNNGGSSPINMSGSITEKGSSRYWSHIGWLIVWPLLLVKGGDGVIPAGTRHTIYTIGDTYLNTNVYPVNYYGNSY